jgi:hypothetical protein
MLDAAISSLRPVGYFGWLFCDPLRDGDTRAAFQTQPDWERRTHEILKAARIDTDGLT